MDGYLKILDILEIEQEKLKES